MKKIINFLIKICLIIVFLIVIYLCKNIWIINKLKGNFLNNINENNYYIQEQIIQGDTYIITDMYKTPQGAKLQERKISINDVSQINQTTFFHDKITTFVNYGTDEQVIIENGVQERKILNPYNLYTFESESNILVELFNTKIYKTVYNDKECYIISNSIQSNMYIDKETGLVLKTNNGTVEKNGNKYQIETRYYYEFNNVTNEEVEMDK